MSWSDAARRAAILARKDMKFTGGSVSVPRGLKHGTIKMLATSRYTKTLPASQRAEFLKAAKEIRKFLKGKKK